MKLSISLGERTVNIESQTKLDGFQVQTASEKRH
jgi:hypothetical protein